MRVEAARVRPLIAMLLAVGTTLAGAFEPGTTRVCTPSVDGSRFECHDVKPDAPVAGAVQPDKSPVEPAADDRHRSQATSTTEVMASDVPAAIEPERAAVPAAESQPAGSARALPNYLLQNPRLPETRARSTEPADPDLPPAASESATVAVPAQASASGSGPIAVEIVPTPETPAAIEPADMPAVEPAVTAEAALPAVAAEIATDARTPDAAPTAPSLHRASIGYADAGAFRRLAGNRYTLEIARARTPVELGALIAALDGIDGTLYLIGLRNPEGTSHSLVWSDFPTIEAARAARLALPADIAITSGWPRRIGPLHAELIGP